MSIIEKVERKDKIKNCLLRMKKYLAWENSGAKNSQYYILGETKREEE